jgi:hypothetical protein
MHFSIDNNTATLPGGDMTCDEKIAALEQKTRANGG